MLIQMQGGGGGATGTADNGLGSPYVENADGRGGHSSGARVDVYGASNGEVKVTASLSASCTTNDPNIHPQTQWSYSAQIVSISFQRSSSWSNGNTYPATVREMFGSNKDIPYGVPHEVPWRKDLNGNRIDGPFMLTFTELKAEFSPPEVGTLIPKGAVNIKNTYTAIVSAYDANNTPIESLPLATDEDDPPFPEENIVELSGGSIVLFNDAPGYNRPLLDGLFPDNPDYKSVTVHHKFTTQLTYQGKRIGPVIHWETILTATVGADGLVSYSNIEPQP